MLLSRLVAGRLLAGLMILGAGVASGQDYPNKPVRIITSMPGGSGDLLARLIAPGLSDIFGQPVIVDNRAGIVTAEIVAKAKPGTLNYAYAVTGSPSHLAGELFKGMAGINIVSIPYKGGGPAVTDLIGGQVQLMFIGAATAAPHLKSGRFHSKEKTHGIPLHIRRLPHRPQLDAA